MAKAKQNKKEKKAQDMGSISDIVSQHSSVTPSKPKATKTESKSEPAKVESLKPVPVEPATVAIANVAANKIEKNKSDEAELDPGRSAIHDEIRAATERYNKIELPKKIKKAEASLKKLPADAPLKDVLKAVFDAWDDGLPGAHDW